MIQFMLIKNVHLLVLKNMQSVEYKLRCHQNCLRIYLNSETASSSSS